MQPEKIAQLLPAPFKLEKLNFCFDYYDLIPLGYYFLKFRF